MVDDKCVLLGFTIEMEMWSYKVNKSLSLKLYIEL